MDHQRELSVIIPAFNESRFIANTINQVKKTLGNPGLDYEIIVVDNGSMDNTYDEAVRAVGNDNNVKIVKCNERGKGCALRSGFKHSSGELVTFIDADSDLQPKQIKSFIKYMKKFNVDVVVGSKRHPLSKVEYPFIRRILSNAYYLLVRTLFGLPIRDTQTGLKLFKSKVLEKVLPKVLVKKYAFDLEVLVNAQHNNFKIIEAPVDLNFQRFSSRIRFKDIWHIFVDTAAIFYRLNILKYYDS